MARKKSVVVTFRVDAHLAEALDQLPDRSAFIRDAILERLHDTCPACGGEGRVHCDSVPWLQELFEKAGARSCTCCATVFVPSQPAAEICTHCDEDEGAHKH